MTTTRLDGRSFDANRKVSAELGFQQNPEGSVLYSSGKTRVLIAVTIEDGVRDWMRGQKRGWITAEYAMHTRANQRRNQREGRRRGVDGRSTEIQRLVGRSLRAAVRLDKLGERTITVDCDVLDADGGTRTASITGGYLALAIALDKLRKKGLVEPGVLREPLAAVSSGFLAGGDGGRCLLDLCYEEDSKAEVDLNVVATQSGAIVEVQGTAEGEPIQKERFDSMLDLALKGIRALNQEQAKILDGAGIAWQQLLA